MELISFYNVENFFVPDENLSSELNVKKSGLRNWTNKRYQNKLKKIAHVFHLMKEYFGVLPFIIGLSEISSDQVLQDVLSQEVFDDKYGYIHYESMDERGVDVALLYDKTKVELIDSEPISFFFDKTNTQFENFDMTRDVLLVKLKYNAKVMNVLVAHLPSQREKINQPKRTYILSEIRERIIQLLQSNEAVIFCGDLNENPNDENLKKMKIDNKGNEMLLNPFEKLFTENNFSTFHYKFGLLFDQVLLSTDFFNGKYPLQFQSAHVFNHVKVSNWDKKFQNRPFRTYAGTRYLGGYSDHFPVCVSLKKVK